MGDRMSPWGWEIGLYFVLAGLASGIALMCWLIRPREQEHADHFEWIANLVALAAIAVCTLILIVDLDRPARFFLMLTEFSNLGSVMSVGAKLIALKMGLLVLYLYLLHRRRQAHAAGDDEEPDAATRAFYRITPAALGVVSLGVAVYPAFLLSRTWVSPLALSPGSALLFLSTAMIMGAAVAAIAASSVPRLSKEDFRLRIGSVLTFLLAAQIVLLVLEVVSLHGNQPALARALDELVAGGAAHNFWWVCVGVGIALPLAALVAMPRSKPMMVTAAICALIGAGMLRYLFYAVA